MTAQDSALQPFDVLIGTWKTEVTHPLVDGVVTGETTFEWLRGRRFLIQRSQVDDERFPDVICVIGPPEHGDGLVMEHFDSRGVRRTYEVAFEDGVMRWWRDEPGFAQRYEARPGGDVFEGKGQLAREPGDWEADATVVYHRHNPD